MFHEKDRVGGGTRDIASLRQPEGRVDLLNGTAIHESDFFKAGEALLAFAVQHGLMGPGNVR